MKDGFEQDVRNYHYHARRMRFWWRVSYTLVLALGLIGLIATFSR